MNATMKLCLSFALMLVAGGLSAYAPDAAAQVGPLKNNGTGRCLTVTSIGSGISQPCNGSLIQTWSQGAGPAGILLKNVQTGQCLDTNAAGAVFTSLCNPNAPTQNWIRLNVAATTARFRSAGTGLFLNSSAAGAINATPPNGLPLQLWTY